MEFHVRRDGAGHFREADVLDDEGIHPGVCDQAELTLGGLQFAGEDEGIHRDEAFHAVLVQVGHEFGQVGFGKIVGAGRGYVEAAGRVDVTTGTAGSHKQKNWFVGGIDVASGDTVHWSEYTDEEDEFLGLQLYGRRALIDGTQSPEEGGGTPWNNWFEWQVLELPVAGPVITQSAHDSVFYTLYFGEGLSNCELSDEAIDAVKLGWVGGV